MAKVLIVDDDGDSLRLLQAWLTRGGFEVTAAGNGAEALEAAQKNPPDLVVSDILMPVMDGFDLCRKWKADERLRHIPFVFYSANYTKPEDVKFGLDAGADRFVVKPQRREDLLRALADALKKTTPSGPEKAGPFHRRESIRPPAQGNPFPKDPGDPAGRNEAVPRNPPVDPESHKTVFRAHRR